MGATCEFRINHGYPMLMNDYEVTRMAREFAVEYLGNDNVEDMGLRMTCEDFAYYSQQFPVAFFRFGVKKPGSKEIVVNSRQNPRKSCAVSYFRH